MRLSSLPLWLAVYSVIPALCAPVLSDGGYAVPVVSTGSNEPDRESVKQILAGIAFEKAEKGADYVRAAPAVFAQEIHNLRQTILWKLKAKLDPEDASDPLLTVVSPSWTKEKSKYDTQQDVHDLTQKVLTTLKKLPHPYRSALASEVQDTLSSFDDQGRLIATRSRYPPLIKDVLQSTEHDNSQPLPRDRQHTKPLSAEKMPSTPDLDSDAESDGDEASSTPESGSDSDSEGDWRSDSSRLSDTIPSLVQSAKNPDGLRYFQDWIQDLRPKFNQFYSSNDYINDHETLRDTRVDQEQYEDDERGEPSLRDDEGFKETLKRKQAPKYFKADHRVVQAASTKRKRKEVAQRVSKARLQAHVVGFGHLSPDLVLHICEYLDTLDLARLCHVNTSLKSCITYPSWWRVWAAARERVPDLPECIEGMKQADYGIMIFHPKCQVCEASRARAKLVTNFQFGVQRCAQHYNAGMLTLEEARTWIGKKEGFQPIAHHVLRWATCDPVKYPRIMDTAKLDVNKRVFSPGMAEVIKASWVEMLTEKKLDINDWVNMQENNAAVRREDAEKMAEVVRRRVKEDEKKRVAMNAAYTRGIKDRVLKHEDGWIARDFPEKEPNWRQTLGNGQGQELTDENFARIYPRLEPLLKARRIDRLRKDKHGRRIQVLSRTNVLVKEYLAEHPDHAETVGNTYDIANEILNIPLVKRLVDRSVEVKVTDVMWAGVCRAVKAAIVVAFKERRGTAKPQEAHVESSM